MASRNNTRSLVRVDDTTQTRAAQVPWPLLILLLGTLLLMLVAYVWRPTVSVSPGTRYDAPFLDGGNLHDREFRAAEPQHDFTWPTGETTFVIDTDLSPAFEMMTLTVDPWQPQGEFKRRLFSVFANGDEIANFADTGETREFRTLLPAGATASGRLTLRAIPIPDRNTTQVPSLQIEKVSLAAARTYRWTTERSAIQFPALGKGDWQVTLSGIVYHPDDQPVGAKLYANGTLIADLPDYAGVRDLSAIIPASVVGDGDLTLTLEAKPFNDPRPLGVLLERVQLSPIGATSMQTMLPPLSVLVPALVIVVALYGSLRRVNTAPWLAATVGFALAVVGVWALIAYRFPITFYLRPLAVLMLFSLAMALFVNWFAEWLFAALGLPLSPWLRRALVLTFLVGFWLKAGGLIFPYMRAIDIQWHMDWVRRLLSGQVTLGQLYGTNSPLNELTMPVDEWGADRPVIPYSPFFQLFAVSFSLFPWKLETTANVLSALLDSSRVFLIAMLTLKAGLSNRVAMLAALLYAITPVTFLLHAWGNAPTTFGMWLTMVATAIIVVCWERLHRPWPFGSLVAVTLACMLFYTVMAAFHLLFIMLFALIAWLMRKQLNARPIGPMLLATGVAFGLSVLIYYGQYIVPVLSKTLPYMLNIFSRGPETVGVERPPFGQYLLDFLPHLGYWIWPGRYLYYGLALPLLAVVPGFLMLRGRQPLWAALAAWFTVALLFMLVGYRLSMVDKQLFYILTPICICAAVVADWFWKKGLWARLLVGAIYLGTFASALALWIIRIYRSPFG